MDETASRAVSMLGVTPIKGLRLSEPAEVVLTESGIAGDREFFLVTKDGALLSVSKTGAWLALRGEYDAGADVLSVTSPDLGTVTDAVRLGEPLVADFYSYKSVHGRVVEGPWADLFSEAAGRPVRLVRATAPNGGIDVRPVTLLGDASVEELARHAGRERVDPRRFRMLVGFSGGEPHDEDRWEGRLLRVGEALVRVEGPVKRCAAITRSPSDGSTDLRALHVIKAYRGVGETILGRGLTFGVYADVVRPGRVALGDDVVPETG